MEAELQLDLPIAIAAPLVLICLGLGAYMSAAETAVTGTSRPRMHRLAQQGNQRAAIVNRCATCSPGSAISRSAIPITWRQC